MKHSFAVVFICLALYVASSAAGLSDGEPCWINGQCTSRYCDGVCKTKALAGQPCEANADCTTDWCGRSEAGTDDFVCCNSLIVYAWYSYCSNMVDGKRCWSDAMCAAGLCKDNCGGFCKGTCTSKKADLANCSAYTDCHSGVCALSQAGSDHLHCCPHGRLVYAGYVYCRRMPDGNKCWSDSMCNSGNCSGNWGWGGIEKGICD